MTQWLIHGDLPPVGTRVVWDASQPPPTFTGYSVTWLNSGAEALAVALKVARVRASNVSTPKVLLPAYGCPDLVAAALFAGVEPVLVDIGAGDPGYRIPLLRDALSPDVVAVIAVNFLGLRERLGEIRALLRDFPHVLLIEDDAQWFPEPLSKPGLVGDIVVLSFGRGKPVNLLGGGALLLLEGLVAPGWDREIARRANSLSQTKARLFNLVLDRRLHWMVNRSLMFGIGGTVYEPVSRVAWMDRVRVSRLGASVAAYVAQPRETESRWSEALDETVCLRPVDVEVSRRGRLLRFPVLCESANQRDRVLAECRRAGLGASAMYGRPLRRVAGIDGKVVLQDNDSGAQSFADRLLTLPTHRGVTPEDVRRFVRVMRKLL